MLKLKVFVILTLGLVVTANPARNFNEIIDGLEEIGKKRTESPCLVPRATLPRPKVTIELKNLINENSEHYQAFYSQFKKGYVKKGLTFNLYNDNMRDTLINFFRLVQSVNQETANMIWFWAKENIHDDVTEYVWRLASLYSNKKPNNDIDKPPYILRPNYFIRGDTIYKAMTVQMNDGNVSPDYAEHYQLEFDQIPMPSIVYINTNYTVDNEFENETNYFREDVSLNSYYYGQHLLHPFWMSNTEMDEVNPRHAEHYYFIHKQLLARYNLEKENLNMNPIESKYKNYYNPALMNKNGLVMGIRTVVSKEMNDNRAYISSIDITLRELLSRGLYLMSNGSAVDMDEENHTDLIAKLIRANLDSVKAAKIIRFLFGYNEGTVQSNKYDAYPSVLHHPETSLRDPIYWELLSYITKYFEMFKDSLQPYDLSRYETTKFKISAAKIPNITTLFANYNIDISNALKADVSEMAASPVKLVARQRRLSYEPFEIKFRVNSDANEQVVVRLFLGPQCNDYNDSGIQECMNQYSKFFELDVFHVNLKQGKNTVTWSPMQSLHLSDDSCYDAKHSLNQNCKYNVFQFPKSLVVPKGTEEGRIFTLFVMVTASDERSLSSLFGGSYDKYVRAFDSKPLGFPFHRKFNKFSLDAVNYRVYKVRISHRRRAIEKGVTFAHNLY